MTCRRAGMHQFMRRPSPPHRRILYCGERCPHPAQYRKKHLCRAALKRTALPVVSITTLVSSPPHSLRPRPHPSATPLATLCVCCMSPQHYRRPPRALVAAGRAASIAFIPVHYRRTGGVEKEDGGDNDLLTDPPIVRGVAPPFSKRDGARRSGQSRLGGRHLFSSYRPLAR